MNIRRVQHKDRAVIFAACTRALRTTKVPWTKPWLLSVDLTKVMDELYDLDNSVYIVDDTYLVFFEVGSPWYTNEIMLTERLVLSLRAGGDFSSVLAFLDEWAAEYGATRIGVGTALAPDDAVLAQKYLDGGYTQAALTLTKETADVRPIRNKEGSEAGQAGS